MKDLKIKSALISGLIISGTLIGHGLLSGGHAHTRNENEIKKCRRDSDCFLAHSCIGCNRCFSRSPLPPDGSDCKAVCYVDPTLQCKCINGQCVAKPVDKKALLRLLKGKNPNDRRRAALRLGELKDVSAADALIAVLKDKDLSVRMSAAEALAKIKDPRAIEPLIALLNDEEFNVQSSAVDALEKITGQPFGYSREDWRKWHKGIQQKDKTWVSKHFKGGRQCMGVSEPGPDPEKPFRENDISIFERIRIDLPVCRACSCPAYSFIQFFLINKQDLDKAKNLGFDALLTVR